MNTLCIPILFLLSTLLSGTPTLAASPKKGATAYVELSPAGSFEIKAKIKGSIAKTAHGYEAVDLKSKVSSFDTGLDLRTKHTKEKMNVKKFPLIKLLEATADKNGLGEAKFEIRGVSRKVKVNLKMLEGNFVQANFTIDLKSFGFAGINYMGIGVQNLVKVEAIIPLKKNKKS